MKFSIVTPVYNGEKYIAETIESILSQEGNFEVEYVVADGGSVDGTLCVVKAYAEKLRSGSFPIKCDNVRLDWFSGKDNGMYDAVEKGFAKTGGNICAWLNSDDVYMPGAFASVAAIFTTYPDINWVKGINKSCDENGIILSEGACRLYRREWLLKGVYGRSAYFVDQESVFWRRSLLEKARPSISSFRLAGDYALWASLARFAPLWSFNKHVSIFRRRPGQLSTSMKVYREEQRSIVPKDFFLEKKVALFFSSVRFLRMEPKSILARTLFAVLFPFERKEWYIDFDTSGLPVKKLAVSYVA